MIGAGRFIIVMTLLSAGAASVWAVQEKAVKREIKRSQIPRELFDFRERLARISSDLRVPGVAVAVVANDRTVYLEATGTRDPVRLRPVTADTVFYIGSCTKPFVAMAILALAEDGKLDLDAPVRKYLPKFEIADAKLTKTLTVRDLLSHAKGLDSDPITWLDAYTGEISEERYYRWLKRSKATGTHKNTSVHYTLAGRIIEAVTGQSWKDFLAERIFKPSGMTRTTCYADKMYALEDVAMPAVRSGNGYGPARIRKTDRTMHAAGGMGASVRDLVRWLRLNLNNGEIDRKRIVSESSLAEMHKLHTTGGRRWPPYVLRTEEGHGLGWSIGTYRDRRLISQGGGFVGAAAHISFMPDENLGLAVLTNVDGANAEVIAMEIYDRLLAPGGQDILSRYTNAFKVRLERTKESEALFAKNPTEVGGLSLPPGAYTGTYANGDWGTLHLRLKDGKLVGTLGDLTLRFGAVGTDRFVVGYGIGRPEDGRFELTSGGAVSAVVIDHADGDATVRYKRR